MYLRITDPIFSTLKETVDVYEILEVHTVPMTIKQTIDEIKQCDESGFFYMFYGPEVPTKVDSENKDEIITKLSFVSPKGESTTIFTREWIKCELLSNEGNVIHTFWYGH